MPELIADNRVKSVKDGAKSRHTKEFKLLSAQMEKRAVLQTYASRITMMVEALSYQPYATVENVVFDVNQKSQKKNCF